MLLIPARSSLQALLIEFDTLSFEQEDIKKINERRGWLTQG
jgi:hypothetical protein